MPFIPSMLAICLDDPRRLADSRHSAEPKLDGQRAQLHVRGHRTVHVFSRPGRELIRLAGLASLRELHWPVASAVFDGEAVAGDGRDGIHAVFEGAHPARQPDGVRRIRPARARRPQRHGEALDGPAEADRGSPRNAPARRLPRAGDRGCPRALGHEGRPGRRGHRPQGTHRALPPRRPVAGPWLKLKPKLMLEVVVTGGSAERIGWGDWGEAVMLAFRYTHPTDWR